MFKFVIVLVLVTAAAVQAGVIHSEEEPLGISGWEIPVSKGWEIPHSKGWSLPIIEPIKIIKTIEPIKVIKIESAGWSTGGGHGWDEPIKVIKIKDSGWSGAGWPSTGWESW